MKRLTGIFLLGVIALALFSACKTVDPSTDGKIADLTNHVDRLQGLYKEAVRVPITPQIVNQIRREKKDYLLGEIQYFTSVNVALMHSRADDSAMSLENKALPKVTRSRPAQNSTGTRKTSSTQNAASQASVELQEVSVLTFKEGGSSLDQRKITSSDEGHLKDLDAEGNVFEVAYPGRGITLGFVLNGEENWYNLEFAVDENTGERTSLAMTGVRPHLMINYQAVFPIGETRIQMDKTLHQPDPPTTAGPGFWLPPEPPLSSSSNSNPTPLNPPSVVPPESPPDTGQFSPPVRTIVENPSFYLEGETADWGRGENFYLEEAPPTSWEDLYLGGEKSPDIDVVFLTEKAKPPASDPAAPGPEKTPDGTSLPGLDRYIVQVGAFREQGNASAAFTALERAGFYPLYEAYQDLMRVLIPAIEKEDLARVREKIKALGLGEPYVRQ
jgi:hypothetical protein